MLEPLRRIVQEVNAAPDFSAVLEIIVERVKHAAAARNVARHAPRQVAARGLGQFEAA